MAENTVQPTAAAEWRKPREEGYVVTLPSGHVARLRPVALDVLIMSGSLPDVLTPIAAKALWVDTDSQEIGDHVDQAKGYAELVNHVVPAAMMEPAVVEPVRPADGLEDNEISLEDIDFADKVAVFQLATQPAEVLRRFRDKQERDVEALPDGEDDPSATE